MNGICGIQVFIKDLLKMFRKYALCLLISFFVSHSLQRPLEIKQHLYTYGFLDSADPNPEALEKGLKKFQSVNNITVTGVINDETLEKMNSRRCGRPSNAPLFLAARNKWRKSELTYKISNWTEPFTKSKIKKVFEKGIMAWTDNVNLKITETTSNTADIQIFFTEQDGRDSVLGYAYFPENGDIYFDIDEDWTLDQSLAASKTGFVWVAVHELGHSLGMPHTETRDSIMFPYYTHDVTRPSDSDRRKMKKLYGEAVLDKSVLCSGTSIDAILEAETPLIIKGNQYWTISDESVQSGPFALEMLYPDLPDKIDAAVRVKKVSYFFSNNTFYKYKDKSKNFSRKLIAAGFDNLPSNIDAAFFDPVSSFIYFFKGSQYYVFDIKKRAGQRFVVNGKSLQNDWDGIPRNVNAVTLLKNSRVLFVKGSKCYIVNLNSKLVVSSGDCSSSLYKC